MAKWTISITVYNALDRTLKLEEMKVPWGIEESRAAEIKPNSTGKYTIYAPSGESYGPEYYLAFRDIAPDGKKSYGTVTVHVDIPYWSSSNTLDVTESGVLSASGYAKLPGSQHDYVTTMTISKKGK